MKDSDKNNFDKRGGELLPRELMERAAEPALVPDEALVAVLLKTGTHGLNVIELSRRLIEAFGSMKSLVSSDWRALEERIKGWNKTHTDRPIKGLGHVKCLELSASFEMGRRWSRLAPDELKSHKVTNSATAYRIFKTVLTPGDDKENLYALLLNNKNRPICEPLHISRGTTDSVSSFARDVFKEALKWGAVAVMVAHNHPSGDPTPSKADFKFTTRLVELAKIAEIRFLDHLVICDDEYRSIRAFDEHLFT